MLVIVSTLFEMGSLVVRHCVYLVSWPMSVLEFSCLHLPCCCRGAGVGGTVTMSGFT